MSDNQNMRFDGNFKQFYRGVAALDEEDLKNKLSLKIVGKNIFKKHVKRSVARF